VTESSGSARPAPAIDTTVPHSARIWNYWLGGKDNYEVDRMAGDQFMQAFPDIAVIARASRAFLGRTIRYLAGEQGIRQFLDVGTGLPAVDSTHEIAQQIAPESRIVYVDNDPVVLLHAETLLVSAPEGDTDYIDADMRDPARIVAAAARTLDFSRPVAIIFLGVLGHVPDDEQAVSIVRVLLDAVPSGSYLVLADGTIVVHGERGAAAQDEYNESGADPYTLRSLEQLARFFDGLEMVEPGLVSVAQWRPEPSTFGEPPELDQFGAVARKP
jgi:S-adenosyl methyltransferase